MSSDGCDRVGLLIGSTARTYNTFRKKFAEFVGLENYVANEFLPADCLTDANISKFIQSLGEEGEWKPHILKTVRAALQTDFTPHAIPLFENQIHWPLTTIEMKVRVAFTIISNCFL